MPTAAENSFKELLERDLLSDFPKTELWRLQTDGWQQSLGPTNFREAFYAGMNKGFETISKYLDDKKITAEILVELHDSAYKFEDLADHQTIGFRHNIGASFGLVLEAPGNEKMCCEAGISREGLDEFVDSMLEAYQDKTTVAPKKKQLDEPHRWAVTMPERGVTATNIMYLEKFKFDKKSIKDELCKRLESSLHDEIKRREYFNDLRKEGRSEEFISMTMSKMLSAAETQRRELKNQGSKIEDIEIKLQKNPVLNAVNIICYSTSKEKLLQFVQNSIDTFYKKISDIKQSDVKSDDKKIEAMAALTRELHQTHCFLDGNGRTFIFLMQNLILFQLFKKMMIVNTPNHFAGFSVAQLRDEIKSGMNKLEEYKITNAKVYVGALTAKSFGDEKLNAVVKSGVEAKLSNNPMIALAQISELFDRISKNKIKVPANYWGDGWSTSFYFFSSGFQADQLAHDQMLSILKMLYYEKLSYIVDHQPAPDSINAIPSKKVFFDIIGNHVILADMRHAFSNKSAATDLNAAVRDKIDSYFALPQQQVKAGDKQPIAELKQKKN